MRYKFTVRGFKDGQDFSIGYNSQKHAERIAHSLDRAGVAGIIVENDNGDEIAKFEYSGMRANLKWKPIEQWAKATYVYNSK